MLLNYVKNKKLLFSITVKDCEMQTFTCGKKGGGGKDTSNNGVRLIHHPSGARGEGRDTRDQKTNKRNAFLRLVRSKEFVTWHRAEVVRRLCRTVTDVNTLVEQAMAPQNLKVELQAEQGWIDESQNTVKQ